MIPLFANNPMRFFFLIIAFLLPQGASALVVPAFPQANSHYIKELFEAVKIDLAGKTSPGAGTCTALQKELSRAEAAAQLRAIFVDRSAAATEPISDLSRSACYLFDIRAMEHALALLIRSSVTSAEACDSAASEHYRAAAALLHEKLRQVRAFGLDPRVQVPITGTGMNAPPPTATSAAANVLCPYDSDYAPTGISHLGCQEILLSTFATLAPFPPVFAQELSLLQKIVVQIQGSGGGGLTGALPLFRGTIQKLNMNADAFVKGLTASRFLSPPRFMVLTLLPFVAGNVGESGCFGWPADAGGVVTGSDITRQNTFSDIHTRELTEALAFIKLREEPQWKEYERSLEQDIGVESGILGFTLPAENLSDINREHIARESHLILALRDPQIRMANLANNLHARTRAFTSQAVGLTGSPSGLPPLRDFARRFSTFLSGMCTNRGCTQTLLRAIELSLRDECFPHFRSALFFMSNPTAGTLKPCKALYTD